MLPNTITSAIEAKVALGRLQEFLEMEEVQGRPPLPEVDFNGIGAGDNNGAAKKGAVAVKVKSAKLEWPGGVPLLSDVDFEVPAPTATQDHAHITAVAGQVGTGKSGLLQALIGDLTPVQGSIAVSGKIAYTSQ
eukprot:4442370-Amphidinium_carterae.1